MVNNYTREQLLEAMNSLKKVHDSGVFRMLNEKCKCDIQLEDKPLYLIDCGCGLSHCCSIHEQCKKDS